MDARAQREHHVPAHDPRASLGPLPRQLRRRLNDELVTRQFWVIAQPGPTSETYPCSCSVAFRDHHETLWLDAMTPAQLAQNAASHPARGVAPFFLDLGVLQP